MGEKVNVDDIMKRFGYEAWCKAMMLTSGGSFEVEVGRKRFEITRWYPCWDYFVTAR